LVFTLCILRALGGEHFCSASGLAPQPARRRGKDKLLNVGDQLRRYEKIDVTSYADVKG